MKLNIIKLLLLVLSIGILTFIKVEKTNADCIVCDGGNYRGGGCDGGNSCTGYNMGCQSPNGSHCGDCWKCVNGSYVPSGDRTCNQYSTPWCMRGANYSYCWPRWTYNASTQNQYLWYNELTVPNNKLCCVPGATTCTPVSGCSVSCGGGSQTTSCTNGCSTWAGSQACNTQACCVPNNYIYSQSGCSASCGGGTITYNWTNSCGSNWTTTGSCNTQACNNPPTITYLNAWGYGPKGASGKQLTKADGVCRGDTVRFYWQVADDITPNSAIRYRHGGNPFLWAGSNYNATSWDLINGAQSTFLASSNYWYYDWTIPAGAPLSAGVSYFTWEDMDQGGLSTSSWGTTDGSNSNLGFKIIDPALTAPVNLTPVDGTSMTGQTRNITWSAVANATSYYLGIDDLADGWPGTLDTSLLGRTTTTYSYTFLPGHRYHIWVNGLNVCQTSGPQSHSTVTVRDDVPVSTVSPPPSLPQSCNGGNLLFISWMNNNTPVTWVDIADNAAFDGYYHKAVPDINRVANRSEGVSAPQGFMGCGNSCANKIPGNQELQICAGTTYYVRLFNGTDYSTSLITIPPIPTATPRPWTKTSGGDVHINR